MIICEKARITYTAVPKNACTSIKCFFYHVNTGKDFAEDSSKKNMGYQGIHHLDEYRMGRFNKKSYELHSDKEHAAIIRDPVDRFRSAFKNRLFQYNDIQSQPKAKLKAEEMELDFYPTLGEFIDRLDDYLTASNILRFHLRPSHFYLGNSLAHYHHVVPLKETEKLCDLVRERAGVDVATVHANESRSNKNPDYRITKAQYEKLLAYVASDYEFLQDYYTPRSYVDLPVEMIS